MPHPTDPTAALVELTKGYWAIIDAADAAEIGKYNWHAQKSMCDFYAVRSVQENGRRYAVRMHRQIADMMGLPRSLDVDHESRETLDNRRSNLRPATKSQNGANRTVRYDSSTGIKGVSFSADPRRTKPWCAAVTFERRTVRRYCETQAEAVAAVVAFRRQLHGEFAYQGAVH